MLDHGSWHAKTRAITVGLSRQRRPIEKDETAAVPAKSAARVSQVLQQATRHALGVALALADFGSDPAHRRP
jgi:hypothetical protein